MSIYNKVSELEWYLCQKALLKEFLSKNAYEKYLSDLDRFHAEWEGLHEPKIVETENKSALAVYSPINAMLVLSPGAELNLPLGYVLPKYSRQWPNWKEKSVIVVSTVSSSMN